MIEQAKVPTVTTAVRAIAALYPFDAVATKVYSRFREPKQVNCLEKSEAATVQEDAKMAAATAAVGVLRALNHSLHAVASRLWSRLP